MRMVITTTTVYCKQLTSRHTVMSFEKTYCVSLLWWRKKKRRFVRKYSGILTWLYGAIYMDNFATNLIFSVWWEVVLWIMYYVQVLSKFKTIYILTHTHTHIHIYVYTHTRLFEMIVGVLATCHTFEIGVYVNLMFIGPRIILIVE